MSQEVDEIKRAQFEEEQRLVESLIGRTVVEAEWHDPHPTHDEHWANGHQYAKLTLDDGTVVYFGGWGYDAWGATVSTDAPNE